MRSPANIFFTFLLLISSALVCEGAPEVSNLTAGQRLGTKLVDIHYDLTAVGVSALSVRLEISPDGGLTWDVPSLSATGDVGSPVSPGSTKTIIWNAEADWSGNYSTQMRFRVTASDTINPDFSYIPAGPFTMGYSGADNDADAPPISVTVSSFYLSKHEITKLEWDTVRSWAISNGYSDLSTGEGKASDHPIQTVSWWDAVKWCNARSEMEGLTPCYTVGGQILRTGTTLPDVDWLANGYRLPTEAEWERAARGGIAGLRFPHANDFITHAFANYSAQGNTWGNLSGSIGFHPSYNSDPEPYTSPAGSFPANPYGLKDMSGNVWEWCWDWYDAAYYQTSAGTTNPRGPSTGTRRIRRGGSWFTTSYSARSSMRFDGTPTGKTNLIGFRAARSIIP